MNEFQYAVEDYIHFIQVERQLSVNTLASYRRDLESYVNFLQNAEGMADFNRVERTTFRATTCTREDKPYDCSPYFIYS